MEASTSRSDLTGKYEDAIMRVAHSYMEFYKASQRAGMAHGGPDKAAAREFDKRIRGARVFAQIELVCGLFGVTEATVHADLEAYWKRNSIEKAF